MFPRRWRRRLADARYYYLNRTSRRSPRSLPKAVLILIIVTFVIFSWTDSLELHEHRIVTTQYLKERFRSLQGHHETPRDPREWSGWKGINAIFAFGDSYTDTSFNPNGPQPDEDNPLGNPAWPGRTASYGPNYLGHLVSTFRNHHISAYNFANRASPFVATMTGMEIRDFRAPMSFEQQIDMELLRWYGTSSKKTSHSKEGWGKWYQRDSLFLIYTGSDDILNCFKERGGGTNEAAAREHIEALEFGLAKLYNSGARNFLILNYPSLEASPFARALSNPNTIFDLGADIVHHNGRLAFLAHRFAYNHPDANLFLFDQHSLSLDVRNDPARFPETAALERLEGFCFPYAEETPAGYGHGSRTEEVWDTLCEVGMDRWFWRDERHHTEPYERLLARKIVELLEDGAKRLPLEWY